MTTQAFNCSLLSSCELRHISPYNGVITSSGDKYCQPEPFKRRKCSPACKPQRPFCHGRCVFGGRQCFFHPCSKSPYREGSGETCVEQVHNLINSTDQGCKEPCSDISNGGAGCQSCLEETMPELCQLLSGASCWKCSGQVWKHLELCSTSTSNSVDIVQCIEDNVVTECKSCVCTLLCYLSPGGDLCKSCLQEPELASLFIHSDKCQTGWVWSSTTSKCYKAYTNKKPWVHACFIILPEWWRSPCRGQGQHQHLRHH